METAKALALQAYEEELFTRRSAQAEEERVQESDEAAAEEEEKITKKAEEEEGAEEVEEAEKAGVEALGYESLEQMRRYNHTVYDIEKAYFVKLTGYWYPEKTGTAVRILSWMSRMSCAGSPSRRERVM